MTEETELLIVIVNYNGLALTLDCLESLEPEMAELPSVRVGVCDNGSRNSEANALAEAIQARGWSEWAALTRLPVNLGFTGGNNAVIRPALERGELPNFVLLLNNDTIVRPGAIRALLEFMKAKPEAGIAGSRLEFPDGTPQISAFRFMGVASEFDRGLALGVVSRMLSRYAVSPPVPEADSPADWVAGASMIIRREVIESVGTLDDDYYTYFDDIDYCNRALKAGWLTWYVPASRVVHLVGQTTGVTAADSQRKRRPEYYYQARRRYLTQHLSPLRAAMCDFAFLTGHALNVARCKLTRRSIGAPAGSFMDHMRYSVICRGFRSPVVQNPLLVADDK